jgi:hypothetical protein
VNDPKWPTVICPGCKVKMAVKKIVADGRGMITGKILYVCEVCKTETERPYKGPRLREPLP